MNKFDWECWNHYGIEQKFRKIGSKLDELVEGYNEIMEWRRKHIDKEYGERNIMDDVITNNKIV